MRRSATARPSGPDARETKLPFDIDQVMRRIREAVGPLPKAAMFQLAEEGFNSVFEQLAACIISIRTLDQVTVPTARRFFTAARTPAEVAKLEVAQIDQLIHACTFHGPKARTIQRIAREVMERYGGKTPESAEAILEFKGVGPKCTNLALGVAKGQPHGIGVDIHVHRVTNRWGYVHAGTPEKTMEQLQGVLPKKYWIEINKLLVPFGKHICTGKMPRCSTCPVLKWCRQVGVKGHR